MNLTFYLILFQFLFSIGINTDELKNEIIESNRQTIINFVNENDLQRSVIIEDFETDTINILTYTEQDFDPEDWSMSSFTPDSNSTQSLVLFGNTWKNQLINFIQIQQNSVWQVDMYSSLIGNGMASEIQAIGVEDTMGNKMHYSIWGAHSPNSDYYENYYQGYFDTNYWTKIILPIGSDWYDRFHYEPVISKLYYINDYDGWWSSDSIYFDNIQDITMDLPIAPSVEIEIESISQIEMNNNNRLTQSYQFNAIILDSDSELDDLNIYWDFGDGNTDTIQNPQHTYDVQDDHLYTVFLTVEDQTGLFGYATQSVVVDEGDSTFPIKMNFVGDIMMGRRYNCTSAPTNDEDCNDGIIPECEPDYLFDYINPYFGEIADISIGNLETPIIEAPVNPHPTKSIVFYSEPETMSALESSGIDVVSLANNHFLDYMVEGLVETQII